MPAPADLFPVIVHGPGLPTLIRTILAQQVSTRAAAAMWCRLRAHWPNSDADAFLGLDDACLRTCGFSRQKASYARDLAAACRAGEIPFAAHAGWSDAAVAKALREHRGIGAWSAACYLIFGLGRPDILASGDLALQVGWQEVAGAAARPRAGELEREFDRFRPHRTAAGYLVWRAYLARRTR